VVFEKAVDGFGSEVREIFRYRNGVTEQITDSGHNNFHPVTDGINIVYQQEIFGDSNVYVRLYTVGGEDILLGGGRGGYQVNDGWVAFERNGPSGFSQVWVRHPDGYEEQISYFSTCSILDKLSSDGELMYINFDYDPDRHPDVLHLRYLGVPSKTPELELSDRISNHWDEDYHYNQRLEDFAYKEGGEWYVVIGGSLFAVNDNPSPPDGGHPDGSVDGEDGLTDGGDGQTEGGSCAGCSSEKQRRGSELELLLLLLSLIVRRSKLHLS
jgi:hypothetical protein